MRKRAKIGSRIIAGGLLLSVCLSGCTFQKLVKVTITGDKAHYGLIGGDNLKAEIVREVYFTTDKVEDKK